MGREAPRLPCNGRIERIREGLKMKAGEKKFWEQLKSGEFASMVKEVSRGKKLENSAELYNILKPLYAQEPDVESTWFLFLNAKNHILSITKMFSGSITSAPVYPREIVKKVLETKATSVVMSHNHPSGDPEPSADDLAITNQIAMAMCSIDVNFFEHMIVVDGSYFSMVDQGIIDGINRKVRKFLGGKVS